MKLLIFICYLLGNSFAKDLLSYIEKCSLTSPSISNCIRDKASIAIGLLAKGEETLGIPSISPLHLPKAVLEADNFQIFVEDVYIDGLQNMKITDGLYDIANKQLGFSSIMDLLTITGRYSLTNGTILTHYVSGAGKLNITVVGCRVKYRGNIRLHDVDGEQYMQIYGSTMDFRADRSSYYFENLKSNDTGEDMNELIDRNWQVLRSELLPSLSEHFVKILRYYIQITDRVPLTKIFLP